MCALPILAHAFYWPAHAMGNFASPISLSWAVSAGLAVLLVQHILRIRFGWSWKNQIVGALAVVAACLATWNIAQQYQPQVTTIVMQKGELGPILHPELWHGEDCFVASNYTDDNAAINVVNLRSQNIRTIPLPGRKFVWPYDFDGRYIVAQGRMDDTWQLILIDLLDDQPQILNTDKTRIVAGSQSLLTAESKIRRDANQDDLLCWLEYTDQADKIECKIFSLNKHAMLPCTISIPRKIDNYEMERLRCGWIDSGRIGIVALKNIGGKDEIKNLPIVWTFSLADGRELSRREGPICKQSRTSADFSGAFLEIVAPSGESEIIYKNYIDGAESKLAPGPIPQWMNDGKTGVRIVAAGEDKKQILAFDCQSRRERIILEFNKDEHAAISPQLDKCIVTRAFNPIAPCRIVELATGKGTIIPCNMFSTLYFWADMESDHYVRRSPWSPNGKRIVWFNGVRPGGVDAQGHLSPEFPTQCQTMRVED